MRHQILIVLLLIVTACTVVVPTIEPTPTQEWSCQLKEETGLYADKALSKDGLIVLLPAGQNMLPTSDYTDTVTWAVTADGPVVEGYLAWSDLTDDCHPTG